MKALLVSQIVSFDERQNCFLIRWHCLGALSELILLDAQWVHFAKLQAIVITDRQHLHSTSFRVADLSKILRTFDEASLNILPELGNSLEASQPLDFLKETFDVQTSVNQKLLLQYGIVYWAKWFVC